MKHNRWVKEFPGAVTVCDREGMILEMNDRAIATFLEDGGEKLLGRNILDCHPEPARTQLIQMMKERKGNIYTIEKKGKKKLIYQTPWFSNGEYGGLIELSLEIPHEIPHFVRS